MDNRRLWPLVLLASVLGCGGGGGGAKGADGGGTGGAGGGGGSLVSCVITESSGGATILMLCQEATGFYAEQLRAACSRPPADAAIAPHAEITNMPCPHANALGACSLSVAAGSLTGWYYADGTQTSADVAALCAATGQTFVAP
jgi:hypothetical protein